MSKRTSILVGLALFFAALIAMTAAAEETYLGLLGETVEMIPLASTMKSVDLFETPPEVLRFAPEGDDIRYGFIKLGNGLDSRISLAVRLGDEPLLWIDANNNEDLFDDGAVMPDASHSPTNHTWYREITVSYWEDGIHSTAPYILRISVVQFPHAWDDDGWDVIYSGICARKGLVQIGAELHTIWLSDTDSDGLFNDIEDLGIGSDNDGDGTLASEFSSPEWFPPESWLLEDGIVQIGDAFYELIDVSSDGRTLTLVESASTAEPLAILKAGYPAPDFAATSVTGEQIQLSQYLGQPLVLLFAPAFQVYPEHIDYSSPNPGFGSVPDFYPGLEQPRTAGLVRALERTLALIEVMKEIEEEEDAADLPFALVLVATDPIFLSINTPTTLADLGVSFPIIWNETLFVQYRTAFYGAYVIDAKGIIAARDGWSHYYDSAGRLTRADLNPLSDVAILGVLESLIETDL